MPHKDPEARRAYHKAYNAIYHPAHREVYKLAYQANREERLAKHKIWEDGHLEEKVEYNRAYRETNLVKIATQQKSYRQTNRVRIDATIKAWRQANPEKVRAFHSRRRARKNGASINDFTAEQWIMLQDVYDHRCAYCGRRAKGHLTQDHIIPLSKGGNHTLSNVVPACRRCNSQKGTGPVLRAVQPLLL